MRDENLNIDDVVGIDKNLQFLATYELTNGKMVGIDSQEEMFEFQQKIINKFNYFKHLIQTGESTYDDIKNSVLIKNGPFNQISKNDIVDQAVEIMNSKPVKINENNSIKFDSNNVLRKFISMLDSFETPQPIGQQLDNMESITEDDLDYENKKTTKQIKGTKGARNNKPIRKNNRKNKNK